MGAQDRAIQKLAKELAGIKREVVSWRGPQADYTSIENGGNFTFKDSDGNVTAVVGGQDDGGTTINVIAGPTPPTPVDYTVTVDHGSLTVHWDGEFENDVVAPSDWARWTAYAQDGVTVTPSRSTAIGGTDSASGGEVTAGVLKGQWTVTVLAWSQAGKPSVMGDPITVVVPGYGDIVLEEIDAADTIIKNGSDILVTAQDTLGGKLDSAFGSIDSINDDMSDLGDAVAGAVVSANGKNTVTYDSVPPTPADEGIAGDSWFVGQVGHEETVLEENRSVNPSFEADVSGWERRWSVNHIAGTHQSSNSRGVASGEKSLAVTGGDRPSSSSAILQSSVPQQISAGEWMSFAASLRCESAVPVSASLRVYWLDSADTEIDSENLITFKELNSTENSSSENRYIGDAVKAPAGAAAYKIAIWFRSPDGSDAPGAGFIAHIDDVHQATAEARSQTEQQVLSYFDGDTPDGATDNDPHYRWTGEPHASTSEKYLPATDGLSENWNVVAQYRHDGTNWVEVELSHHVISSADVGKLVAGSATIKEAVVQKLWAEVVVAKMVVADEFIGENAILTGAITAPKITASEELWAKIGEFVKIRAEQLEADAIDGMVITGPNIRTAASGARVQLDAGGLSVYDSLDDWQVRLTPDGSSFKGDLEAESLVANGAAEFKSTDNMLAQGAKLTLASGVTDPTAPPIVQPYWEGIEFTPTEGKTYYGLAFAGGKYWTFEDAPKSTNGDRLVSIDPGTGAIGDAIPMTDNFWAAGGVTAIGSELFLLGPKTGADYKYFVRVYSTAGVFLREWEYPAIGYGPGNPLKYKPGIGNDGTNVVIAQCLDSGSLVWRTYNKTTGAAISSVDLNDATKSDISGIYIGPGDHGGGTFVTIAKTATKALPSFTTSGVYAPERSWRMADDASETGIVFADGKFRTLNASGVIREYADGGTGDGSGDWWCAYRWETGTDSDGTIDYRSKISPPARFTWPRRARLKATGQPKPAGVELMAGYLAKNTMKPTRTDFKRNYTGYSTTRSIAYWDWYQNTGDAPADGNTYPTATPSSVASASGTFQVNGDGSGQWGPLTFNTDGTFYGATAAGTAIVPINAANSNRTLAVTFATGRFKTPPTVVPTPVTPDPQTVQVSVANITATGFTMVARRTVASDAYVTWVATEG